MKETGSLSIPNPFQRYPIYLTLHKILDGTEKKEALQLLAVLLKEHDFEVSTQALRIASQYGHPKVESIKQVFYQLINGRGIREPIQPKKHVPDMPEAIRGVRHYDRLFESQGDVASWNK